MDMKVSMTTTTESGAAADKKDEDKGGETVKDLAYYVDHPNEMPSDPLVIEQILARSDDVHVRDNVLNPGDDKGTPKEEDTSKKPEGEKTVEKDSNTRVDGVLTKDGKNVLPYAELERRVTAARDEGATKAGAEAAARKAAEDYAAGLKAQLDEANTKLAAGGEGKKAAEQPLVEIPDDVRQALKEDYPTQYKAIEVLESGLKAAQAKLDTKLAEVDERLKGGEKARQQDDETEVQTLIDQVPDLKAWQTGNESQRGLFARAIAVESAIVKDDALLKERPELLTDDVARYKEVVARVKQEVGLPASTSSDTKPDAQKKADEAVAGAKTRTPNSLSDLPAGGDPTNSEVESLENVSAATLGARFLGMTADQRNEALRRL